MQLKTIDPHLSAFFCTGYMPQKVVGALLEEENLRAIQKPFEPDSFIAMVRETIDTKRTSRPRGR